MKLDEVITDLPMKVAGLPKVRLIHLRQDSGSTRLADYRCNYLYYTQYHQRHGTITKEQGHIMGLVRVRLECFRSARS